MEKINLWKIDNDNLMEIKKDKLDYEKRLETWLTKDISILFPDLLLLGSQIITTYGGKIDLLSMDESGDIVIIELKREKTYREVVAQAIDYATWVNDLLQDDNNNDINDILVKYHPEKLSDIDSHFSKKWNVIPENYNQNHKIMIVGSEIDDATQRIINYLVDRGININVINFNYFKDSQGQEFLAKYSLIPESELIANEKKGNKRSNRIITELFNSGKLKEGDKLFFYPAIERGFSKDDKRIIAEIATTSSIKCLEREEDMQLYSLSALRKIIINEFNLEGIAPSWGFGVRTDWRIEDGRSLEELRTN